jgi:hypothetical protein
LFRRFAIALRQPIGVADQRQRAVRELEREALPAMIEERHRGLDRARDHVAEVERVAPQLDRAARDPRDVRQIVEQAAELPRLAIEHVDRARRLRPADAETEELDGVPDRRQGVAELVREHGEELVLGALLLAERAQREHADGGLVHRAEDAADPPGVVLERPVGEREVGGLDRPGAVDRQQEILDPVRRAGLEHGAEHRADDVPDLGPALRRRLSERARVLAAEDRPIGVVVDLRELGAPEEDDRIVEREQRPRVREERSRPALARPERGRRPVGALEQAERLRPAGCRSRRHPVSNEHGAAVGVALGRSADESPEPRLANTTVRSRGSRDS